MSFDISISNIVILRGVDLANLHPERRALSAVPISAAPRYDSVPDYFTDVESWPKSTNLTCWFCHRRPQSYPRFVPKSLILTARGEQCPTEGVFDLWACAAAHIRREYRGAVRTELQQLLTTFEEKFSGVLKLRINEAEHPRSMQQYSGDKGRTPEEYDVTMLAIEASHPPLPELCRPAVKNRTERV